MNDQIDWTRTEHARQMGLDYTPKTSSAVAFCEALGDALAALETHRKNQRRGKRKKAFNEAAGACKRRSKNPSPKRPDRPVAPE